MVILYIFALTIKQGQNMKLLEWNPFLTQQKKGNVKVKKYFSVPEDLLKIKKNSLSGQMKLFRQPMRFNTITSKN